MNHNRLIGSVVKIKDPKEIEVGFGAIVKYEAKLFQVRMLDGLIIFVEPDRLIVQPTREEALVKIRNRLNDWHRSLPGCADKDCYSCARQKSELDEALNLLDLLEVL
jgi:hypothetical protein